MKLIIGLGNPREKYTNNRHNVGFMVIDRIKEKNLKIKNAIVVKTNTFMNDSGTSVKELLNKNKVSTENLYVIHDDLDLPLGAWKIQFAKGPKDNGGINSIEQVLGSKDFWRIRVGIDNRNPEKRISGEEYVLEDFTDEERESLGKILGEIISKIKSL